MAEKNNNKKEEEQEEKKNNNSIDQKKSKRMQLIISKTLAYGVYCATAITLVGVILMVFDGGTGYTCDLSSINCLFGYNPSVIPHGDYPNSIFSLVSGLSNGRPFAVIELGIVVLLATPVARVAVSILVFLAEHDRKFVIITTAVLAILLFSFFAVPFIPIFHA